MDKDKFALQVTPELMLKLSREIDGPRKKSYPAKPAPQKKRPATGGKDIDRPGWLPVAPVFPGFLPALPVPVLEQNVPTKQNPEQENEVARIRKLLDESERTGEALHKQEKVELEKVKKLAQELHEKQYKAPTNAVPCLEEKEACVRCYSENLKDPLQCAKSVKAFADCSRQAQQGFVAANS